MYLLYLIPAIAGWWIGYFLSGSNIIISYIFVVIVAFLCSYIPIVGFDSSLFYSSIAYGFALYVKES